MSIRHPRLTAIKSEEGLPGASGALHEVRSGRVASTFGGGLGNGPANEPPQLGHGLLQRTRLRVELL